MGSITPNPKKRGYLLPPGYKDLNEVLTGKLPKPLPCALNVNGQIRAKEVRVIGAEGEQLGIMSVAKASKLARSLGIDLVEIASQAEPPICRIVDYKIPYRVVLGAKYISQ